MTDLHDQKPTPPDAPITRHPRDDEASGTHPVRLVMLVALLGFLFLRSGWALPVVILGVVVMIFLHELGHYLAAKWGGMKVTEFFIGFGPKIWSFRKGETEYGLKVIPAGAYVKIIGMNNLEEVEPGDEDRTYREKTFPKRLLVAVAGSAMHFAQALVLLIVMYSIVGVPGGSLTETKDWQVREVVADSAAEDAGLRPGDQIVEMDGRRVTSFESFAETVSERPDDGVLLTVQRDGDLLEIPATVGVMRNRPETGQLGVRIEPITTTTGPLTAVTASIGDFWDQSAATISFLGDFFTPAGISEFAGGVVDGKADTPAVEPSSEAGEGSGSADGNRIISIVGAVQLGSDLTETGMLGFLLFFVAINITIGIINLIPLLPLDGGHVVVALYERIREFARPKGERYHVDFARLIPVVYTVFMLLVVLGMAAIYKDIVDPVSL